MDYKKKRIDDIDELINFAATQVDKTCLIVGYEEASAIIDVVMGDPSIYVEHFDFDDLSYHDKYLITFEDDTMKIESLHEDNNFSASKVFIMDDCNINYINGCSCDDDGIFVVSYTDGASD